MISINPATNQIITEYIEHAECDIPVIIERARLDWLKWKETGFAHRAEKMKAAARILREKKEHYAGLITREMGKIITESRAEIEKCAIGCDFYAEHAETMLSDILIPSDAEKSLVAFDPLGVILAVMPWNFPFWQVFRFASPALMAGNAAVLKHSSNVPGCALAIEEIFREAGFPENLFRTLLIQSPEVERVIINPTIMAVTLTGSEQAGSIVAATAGKYIKKTVMELGGSDAFVVLEDADMEKTVKTAITARMINQGQSCIAAKRFIVVKSRVAEFEDKIREAMELLKIGDPSDPSTQVGPMARKDLVDDIDEQVQKSIKSGAKLLLGGKRAERDGFYYLPTILTHVKKNMPVYSQETFGPVIAIITVKDEAEAITVANDSDFGLGGSVWTNDIERGERVARKISTGAIFVNGLTKSDPRLPFGGIKKSGYGRELSEFGIREFVNIKTIWIGR
ncbi:MAG TPA: NAD-dependent succinate-semialdehyde dehydrogenase [Bacteroidales bacterium]|nr:NAD-dependent succinate-semialdehyde dehydrogenase [Bacteroidales bacterium]